MANALQGKEPTLPSATVLLSFARAAVGYERPSVSSGWGGEASKVPASS